MRRLLPSSTEVIVFAILAIVLTIGLSFIKPSAHDVGFAALAGPIFLFAACMGLRRSPAWTITNDETKDAE